MKSKYQLRREAAAAEEAAAAAAAVSTANQERVATVKSEPQASSMVQGIDVEVCFASQQRKITLCICRDFICDTISLMILSLTRPVPSSVVMPQIGVWLGYVISLTTLSRF